MFARYSLCAFLFLVFGAAALFISNTAKAGNSSCTGGSLYFSAHPVDSLLFENPDLFHDLYVFKCVTTVVFTSGDRGLTGNSSLSLERGLEAAYAWMAAMPVNKSTRKRSTQTGATIQVGKYEVPSWSLEGMPNIQILYLRLPDGAPAGQGYDANGGESLKKLYNDEIPSITTTDGNATYSLGDLQNLIAAILHERQPNNIQVLNYKASVPSDQDTSSDHADHIVSAKLVMDVIESEGLKANVTAYAGDFMRKLDANLNASHPDFERKVGAFLRYAVHDEHMCQSLEECEDRLKNGAAESFPDGDVRFVAQYLNREYYVL